MTSRAITIAGFVVFFAAAGVLAVAARLRRDGLATFSEVVQRVVLHRGVRVLVLFVWVWLGWHFLAR